jgi:hypothetical protein
MLEEGERWNERLKRVWEVSLDLLALKRVVVLCCVVYPHREVFRIS